ncbi:MAG: 6,7-dimethyl-8-ribityllumazine synthase [Rhodobiaceae bacterium]|nr:6,7-dimethyl-8-ribityllumazine synthase [Rhodobiaceae bacterium]MCC0016299.1 6,7-dimethyl-8-ribityllumazine synthase [Rhodobiaceae bacterium]MCC0041610.1 6,7-dimethyl-8-ribityllumazine synthase [Rhodobiaceae bacterium]MCC0052641.1 6,7-dimethyl-8-ribityllumazine synthase [Rhodobiaceae bacterium]
MTDRLLIIESPYYPQFTDPLREGAMAAIKAAGAVADTVSVPGVLEIPAALSMAVAAAQRGQGTAYDGYVLLGCVIRGETSHYDIVANESARAVMDLAVTHQLAVGNGILTVNTGEQARVRSDPKQKNKGGDAARAALAMIALRKCLAGLA